MNERRAQELELVATKYGKTEAGPEGEESAVGREQGVHPQRGVLEEVGIEASPAEGDRDVH